MDTEAAVAIETETPVFRELEMPYTDPDFRAHFEAVGAKRYLTDAGPIIVTSLEKCRRLSVCRGSS